MAHHMHTQKHTHMFSCRKRNSPRSMILSSASSFFLLCENFEIGFEMTLCNLSELLLALCFPLLVYDKYQIKAYIMGHKGCFQCYIFNEKRKCHKTTEMPFEWPYLGIYCSIDQQNCQNIHCLTLKVINFYLRLFFEYGRIFSRMYALICFIWFVMLNKGQQSWNYSGCELYCTRKYLLCSVLLVCVMKSSTEKRLAKNEWIM